MTPAEEAVMADSTPSDKLTHASLEELQGENARHLMDTADRLRQIGLSGIIQLPQIVVVGDQSSGKSSVLEAITGIPFPRQENLCTRFATQIVLRRALSENIAVAIVPDKLRPEHEQIALREKVFTFNDFSKLGELMDAAMEAMGLTSSDATVPRAFARDVLSIEISGPTRPHLTLVDLPGLIHSANKAQSREDVQLITSLVEEYIKEQRTIVLAVVSAKNDAANQIVLSKARDLGADARTLGVVTKVDYLEPDTQNEASWIELAQNKNIRFHHGWHMLRNRSPKEMNLTLEERDKTETIFFSQGNYRQLDRTPLGIDALRSRLSTLLYDHLTEELPKLQKEIAGKLKLTVDAIGKLGQSRSTAQEQKEYLMNVAQQFEQICQAAMNGLYDDDFFGTIDVKKPVADASNIARLRAVVQDVNLAFAHEMRVSGSKYIVSGMPSQYVKTFAEADADAVADGDTTSVSFDQIQQTHAEAVKWAQQTLQRARGRELPGNFAPALIGQLFREQSQPWMKVATAHVDRVATICLEFVEKLLHMLATSDVCTKLENHVVHEILDRRLASAKRELGLILQDKEKHPITYNHYYTTTIQKIRQARQERKMKILVDGATKTYNVLNGASYVEQSLVSPSVLQKAFIQSSITQDMDEFSAEDALICQMAYYKDEMKYFINCVTKQVIERHLISGLSNQIISAVKFATMSDTDIRMLAAEPASISQEREQLRLTKEKLEQGARMFKKAMGKL